MLLCKQPLPIDPGAMSTPLSVDPSLGVPSADAADVHRWVNDGCALLVDVREAEEFAEERIPGSLLMPLSYFDADFFPQISGMKTVLVCATGKRSAAAGKQLLKAGYDNVAQVTDGLRGWKDSGLETEL